MTIKYLAYLLNGTRQELQDENSSDYRWEDDELVSHIQRAMSSLSRIAPRERKTALGLSADDKDIDISPLSPRVTGFGRQGLLKVEFRVNRSPQSFRNFSIWGDDLTLGIDFDPDATEEGTLTGTVTFTKDSASISGSGTAFSTELAAGEFIKKSSGSDWWYEIDSITSDTALTLKQLVHLDDDGADSAASTPYGSEPAYIYWAGFHEVTMDSTTLNTQLEDLVIEGAAAYAMMAWGQEKFDAVPVGGSNAASQLYAAGITKLQIFREKMGNERRIIVMHDYPEEA